MKIKRIKKILKNCIIKLCKIIFTYITTKFATENKSSVDDVTMNINAKKYYKKSITTNIFTVKKLIINGDYVICALLFMILIILLVFILFIIFVIFVIDIIVN